MSTIKVDNIQGTSGAANALTLSGANSTINGTLNVDGAVTLDSTLAVTGVHTVGTNAVATSDGGATTTNIVQGLAKAWAHVTGTGDVAIDDSLNTSGITDRGTGEYTVSYSNNMGNTHYACPFGGKNPSASSELGCLGLAESSDQLATGSIPFRVLFGNGTFGDYNELTLAIIGDLA